LLTSEYPDQFNVLSENATTTSHALSQETFEREQLLKFFIGLEMLGEKKKQRFLLYLLSLQKPRTENQETKTDEL
jgi:hypothetical protein